jgi:hypothetical protein
LADLTSFVPSYVVSKIYHASLADSQFEILANSEGESVWHRAWRALSLESQAFFRGTVSSVVSSGLAQTVSTIFQQSMDFKKNRIRAFQ